MGTVGEIGVSRLYTVRSLRFLEHEKSSENWAKSVT